MGERCSDDVALDDDVVVDDDGSRGPTWRPTPIERLTAFARSRAQRFASGDHTDTAMTVAACLLIAGPLIETIIRQRRLVHLGQFSAFDGVVYGGQSLAGQFRLLLPALAALMIRSCRRPLVKLRMVLRAATAASAFCTVVYVIRVLSENTALLSSSERRLLVMSAADIVALVVANVAIVFNDQEQLS